MVNQYDYTKQGVTDLINDLIELDHYNISNIARMASTHRNTIYRYIKQEVMMPEKKFEYLKTRRGSNKQDLMLYQYFCKKLKTVNGLRKPPRDRKTIQIWINNLSAAKKRLEENSNISIEKMIDFCMSSFCVMQATNPITINARLADLVDQYRMYAANHMKQSRNKLDVSVQVADGFMSDFPKIIRTEKNVMTEDVCLAHAVEKIGGCRAIQMMKLEDAKTALKFAYLEFIKNPPTSKKNLIRSGKNGTVTLKDYR